MAEEKMFELRIITPDRVFYEGSASMAEMTTSEGEIGIYAGHVPTTFILEPGILTVHEGGETKKAALHAGFVEVLKHKVTVLAEIAEWPDEIDLDRAEEAKKRAEQRLKSQGGQVDVMRAELALKRSLARIRLVK